MKEGASTAEGTPINNGMVTCVLMNGLRTHSELVPQWIFFRRVEQ